MRNAILRNYLKGHPCCANEHSGPIFYFIFVIFVTWLSTGWSLWNLFNTFRWNYFNRGWSSFRLKGNGTTHGCRHAWEEIAFFPTPHHRPFAFGMSKRSSKWPLKKPAACRLGLNCNSKYEIINVDNKLTNGRNLLVWPFFVQLRIGCATCNLKWYYDHIFTPYFFRCITSKSIRK